MKRPAFTLIEIIIAITVFTTFIGLAVSSYLSFHRTDQEVLVDRSLLMEATQVMDRLTEDIRENQIDYSYYQNTFGRGAFTQVDFLGTDRVLNETTLALVSPDGLTHLLYSWDSSSERLNLQNGASAGEGDMLNLTSEHVRLTAVNFRIFPDSNPYSSLSSSEARLPFHPIVTLDLTFTTQGPARGEIHLPLHTSVTSRFYQ